MSKLTDQVLSSETVQSARFVHFHPVFPALCDPRHLLPEEAELPERVELLTGPMWPGLADN